LAFGPFGKARPIFNEVRFLKGSQAMKRIRLLPTWSVAGQTP